MQRQAIPATIEQVKGNLFLFFRRILEMEKPLVLCTEVQKAYTEFAPCLEQPCAKMEVLIGSIQEVIVYAPQLYCALRVDIGKWLYVAFDLDSLQYTVVRKSVFLSFKEQLVGRAARGSGACASMWSPSIRIFPRCRTPGISAMASSISTAT